MSRIPRVLPTAVRPPVPPTLLLVALALALAGGHALAHNPRGTAEATIAGKKVSISYGRPSLNGRDMLGQAAPGMIWRLGSEDATSLTSEGQLWFGQQKLEPGSYTLFAKKTEGAWELLVNTETGQSGLAHDPAKDLLAVPLQVEEAPEAAEMFTISLADAGDGMNASLRMQWGKTALVTPLMVH